MVYRIDENILDEKIDTLADFLGIDPKEIEFGSQKVIYPLFPDDYPFSTANFYTPEGTYHIMTEAEAEAEYKEALEQTFSELGMYCFKEDFRDEILDNYVYNADFEKIFNQTITEFAEALETEKSTPDSGYANALIEDCIDRGIITESDLNADGLYEGDIDLIQAVVNDVADENGNDYVYWYAVTYGKEELYHYLYKFPETLDMDAIAEGMSASEYGNLLADQDCKTNELYGYYIFKQNDEDERSPLFTHKLEKEETERE